MESAKVIWRMTNMVIQSQASWGAVEPGRESKRVIRLPQTSIDNDALTASLSKAVATQVSPF